MRSRLGVCVDRKSQVRKEGLVCRLIYEEKRLYIHEVGGETLTTTICNCHWDHIATSVDSMCLPVLQEITQTEEKVFFRPLRPITVEVKEMIGDA